MLKKLTALTAIVAIHAFPTQAENLPNPFLTLKPGDITVFRQGNAYTSYIFDGNDEHGYRQRKFQRRSPGGDSFETEWFDAEGRKTRRKLESGEIVTLVPRGCFGIEGTCTEEARRSNGDPIVTRWVQEISAGAIKQTVFQRFERSGEPVWSPIVEGEFRYDAKGTYAGRWFSHVTRKHYTIERIFGPSQP